MQVLSLVCTIVSFRSLNSLESITSFGLGSCAFSTFQLLFWSNLSLLFPLWFFFFLPRIIKKPEQASPVPPFVSLSAVLTDECAGFFCVLLSLCQLNGFPFHKVSADVDWNTLRQLSKSNCVCPSFLVPHVRSQKRGFIKPNAFISATVLPWLKCYMLGLS